MNIGKGLWPMHSSVFWPSNRLPIDHHILRHAQIPSSMPKIIRTLECVSGKPPRVRI